MLIALMTVTKFQLSFASYMNHSIISYRVIQFRFLIWKQHEDLSQYISVSPVHQDLFYENQNEWSKVILGHFFDNSWIRQGF